MFYLSKLKPMYRLVAGQDLEPPRPKDSHRIRPPDESVKDAIHISALYMIVTYKDYRPLNLLAALELCRRGEIDIVGFDGINLTPDQVAGAMALVDRSLAAGRPAS